MRKILMALVALTAVSLAYCDDPTALLGDLGLGIVSGQNQVTFAGSSELSEPVVGRLVQDGSGNVTFLLGPEPLLAQTTVKGVPGQVVCDKATTEPHLEPFSVCATTDSDGYATFHYSAGTKAGQARHEIRCECPDGALVTDTVVATVEPGPVNGQTSEGLWGVRGVGTTMDQSSWKVGGQDSYIAGLYQDAYGNVIPTRAEGGGFVIAEPNAEHGTEAGRTFTMGEPAAVGDSATIAITRPSGETLVRFRVESTGPVQADSTYPVRLTVQEIAY